MSGPFVDRMPTDEEIEKQEKEETEALDRQEEFEIHRAEQARRIMEEPLLVEAFRMMQDKWDLALRSCDVNDFETFQGARLRLSILDLFKAELRLVLETGTLAVVARDGRVEMDVALKKEREENG